MQQLRFFYAYYDDYCYVPLHVYEGLPGRLFTTILKPKQLKGGALLASSIVNSIQTIRWRRVL